MARGGLVLAVALAAAVGCHHRDSAMPSRPSAPRLPLTNRGTVEPDVSALGTPTSLPIRPTQYRRLTAEECRALAVRNAPLADDLDAHPANDAPLHNILHRKSDTATLSQFVRGYAADEIRNRAAGSALEDYYKLAAFEGQFDLALAAHGILAKQQAEAQKAIDQGLKDRGDVNALRRQVLETESQAAKLEAGIAALNAALAGRLGLDPGDPTPLWPADALRISGEVIEVEQAVATALKCRPDLNLLRTLAGDDGNGSSLANAVLNGVNPLLGNTDPSHPLALLLALVKNDTTKSESKTQRQLLGLTWSREQQAEAEVRAAVAVLRGNRAATSAKVAEVRNLALRVADLEKRAAAGQQVTLELVTARLELLKARGELLQAVSDWHIADVKLRQAMGLLVRE